MTSKPCEQRFVPAFALLLSGFIAWAVHFGLIYGYTGLLCGRPDWARMSVGGIGIVPLGIAVMTVLPLAALAAVLARNGLLRAGANDGEALFEAPFYRDVTLGAAAIGLVAIVWQGVLSIWLVPSCW
ncbi:MAG: hypothetical protein NW223_21285 [Hyphomicrobiaceae bacterium]|nr:hypothetical protein [Hyphomicrobiaceae bacterium]